MQKAVLGIDVGGTNVKLGLVNLAGRIIGRSSLETKSYIRDKNKLIAAMAASGQDLLRKAGYHRRQIKGIGVGLPGLIDTAKGKVILLPNIPGWQGVPLQRILEARLGISTFLENDVNLITLGEWRFGAGRGCVNLICVTLGTGVGSGLILNNELYRGEGFVAGELGHVPLNEEGPACPCGGYGCFERYVGNAALLAAAVRAFRNPRITLEMVTARAEKGDTQARRFWEAAGERIGNGLVGAVNLLNPRLIVIGGGVANSRRFLFKAITATIKRRAMKVQGAMFKIAPAALGSDAGIIGALVLVNRESAA